MHKKKIDTLSKNKERSLSFLDPSIGTQKSRSIEDMSSNIGFVILCVIMIDCAISGSGHWLKIGPISLRIFLGSVGIIVSIPSLLATWKDYIKNTTLVSIILFIIYLLINAFVAFRQGNRTDLILTDLRGFSWFGILIIALSAIESRKRIIVLMKCIIIGGVIQATLINFIYFFLLINADPFPQIWELSRQYQFASISPVSDTIYRISTGSIVYLILSMIFLLYFYFLDKIRIISFITIPIVFFSLLISFTRSSYGAAFLGLLFIIVCIVMFNRDKPMRKSLLKKIVILGSISLIYTLIVQMIVRTNYYNFALQRTLPTLWEEYFKGSSDLSLYMQKSNESDLMRGITYMQKSNESDLMRGITVEELREAIIQSPLFGNGLGYAIKSRSDGLVEYFYLDILAKTGIIGLTLFCYPFCSIIVHLIRSKNTDILRIVLSSGLVVFFSASYFNPYLNTSLGICYYSCIISANYLLGKKF